MNRPHSIAAFIAALLLGSGFARAQARTLTFEHDVRPILRAHCVQCHGEEEKPKGGIDLRLRRFMDKETEDGAHLLVPGRPADSEIVRVIREGEMPKKGKKLAAAELATLEQWVEEGAKTSTAEPESLPPGPLLTEDDRSFWSFQPITRPAVPRPDRDARVRTPIDAFILARLGEQHLDFAPEAAKGVLLRRVTLDLTGLPPTPEELEGFLEDQAPDAYEKVVDRLLASPAYGERWGRHWLDVAGYADSNGVAEADSPRLHAWRYRDYVIRSFNADKPWTAFIQEQLAGDELAGVNAADAAQAALDPQRRDLLLATGFLRMAPDGTGNAVPDFKLARNQAIAEEIKVVTTSLLGLSVGCAQCHDHRYDPLPQADYYRLRAIFDPAFDWENWRPPSERLVSLYTPEERAQAAAVEQAALDILAEAKAMERRFLDEIFEKEVLKLPEEERALFRAARALPDKERTPEQNALIKKHPRALALSSLGFYDKDLLKKVTDKQAEAVKLRATKPVEGMIMVLTEVKNRVPETKVFHRGDYAQPKQAVSPGELTVLAGAEGAPFQAEKTSAGTSGRRLAYARWLTSGRHPLVARVLVNRFWFNHFGRGLVNTPSEFGTRGERPTHPELLDWLASEFMDGGWKLKPLQRLIVLSTVYRQEARQDDSLRADPENKLYGRFKLQRLDAEEVRDSMLAAAGTLNREAFGAPISTTRDRLGRVVLGKERPIYFLDVEKVEGHGSDDFRRSIYVQRRRSMPLTVLEAFDEPAMDPNCEARKSSTVTPQALLLMNDSFVLDAAQALARRLRQEAPGEAREQIARAWRLLFGVSPSQAELLPELAYLAEQTELFRTRAVAQAAKEAPLPDPQFDALASLCQVLLASTRFLYIE